MDVDPAPESPFKGTVALLEAKLTSGTILKQTFGVFFTNLPAFGSISLLVLALPLLFQWWLVFEQPFGAEGSVGSDLLGSLLSAVFTPLATGALTYGVFQVVRGAESSVGDCLSVGLRRLPPVFLVGILQGLLVGIGSMLCLVPGIIAATILAVAVPAAVIEQPGVMGALSRSAGLTKEFRWTVFGVIFTIGLLLFGCSLAISSLMPISMPLWFIGYVGISVVFTGLQATAGSLLYYHLRNEKEALDVEAIAEVFA